MNLQNYYYYFQSALTPRFCDEVIKYGIAQQDQMALTGGQTEKVNKGKQAYHVGHIIIGKHRQSHRGNKKRRFAQVDNTLDAKHDQREKEHRVKPHDVPVIGDEKPQNE